MSLPREWSFQDSCRSVDRATTTVGGSCGTGEGGAASQEMVSTAVIDENMNQQNQLGSLLSIHSAPVFDLSNGVPSPKRPASLMVQATATSTPVVPPHLQSPPDTIEDEDNENLLTISSLTARPLIAKSRELRSSKTTNSKIAPIKKKKKPKRRDTTETKKSYLCTVGWWIWLGRCIWCLFRPILGRWPGKILWRPLC